jgi:hypothetical protein
MHEPLYILTNVIPKDSNGEFEVYLKDLYSGKVQKRTEKIELRKKYKNISRTLQFFIQKNVYPHSIYDNNLQQQGNMDFESFKSEISQRCTTIDIEVLNPNRIPQSNKDEIVCISYGNDNSVVVRFNGEGEEKVGKNYFVYFDDEKNLLKETFEDLKKSSDLFLCGHNIFGFDLTYMKNRAEILGIQNEIKTYSAKTLFNNKNISILPYFINIDLLPISQYASFPSTKLEYIAKIFGIKSEKMPIEELWSYYKDRKFESIINHNVNDVKVTFEILKRFSPSIYFLAGKTIGTFTYGLYSNLPKNMMIRTLLNHYKGKGYRINEILEKINEELKKISFSLDSEEVKEKLEIRVNTRIEKAKLLNLPLIVSEKLKNLDCEKLKNFKIVFEDFLKDYQEIDSNSIDRNISQRIVSGILYKLLLSMRKKKEYKDIIESAIEEIKDEVKNSKVYCSSGKYLVVDDFQDSLLNSYSSSLTNVILYSEPKVFLANYGGILIGTIPRNHVETPVKFYEALIQDLFNISLGESAEEMKKIGERLEKGEISVDDLKIQVSGVDTTQLTRDSPRKKFVDETVKRETKPEERIYKVKVKSRYLSLEEIKRNPKKIEEVDLEFYKKKFSELYTVLKKIKSLNSLNSFLV